MLVVRSSTSKKRTVILSILAVLLLVAAVLAFMAVKQMGPFASSDDTPTPTVQNEDDTALDEDIVTEEPVEEPADDQITDGQRNPSGEGGDKPVSNTPEDSSSDFESAVDAVVNSDSVRLNAMVQKAANSGKCNFTITGSKTIKKSSDIHYPGGQVSYCKDVNIAKSELGSGSWSVRLEVTAGGQKSISKTEFKL